MISSRTLLLFLIALNLVALAWWSGAMAPLSDSVHEPDRLKSQIDPERLILGEPVALSDDGNLLLGTDRATGAVAAGQLTTVSAATPASAPSDESGPASNAGVMGYPGYPTPGQQASGAPIVADGSGDLATKETIPAGREPKAIQVGTAPGDISIQSFGSSTSNRDLPIWTKKSVNSTTPSSVPSGRELPLVAAAISGVTEKVWINPVMTLCHRYRGLSYVAAREVEDDLAPLGIRADLNRADKGDFLVYIEPLATLQLARRKEQQLRKLGVADLHVIRAGYYRNGISLGMLRNRDLAAKHKLQMANLGVATMRVGPVNVLSARYDITVKANAQAMQDVVGRHEVLSAREFSHCVP